MQETGRAIVSFHTVITTGVFPSGGLLSWGVKGSSSTTERQEQ